MPADWPGGDRCECGASPAALGLPRAVHGRPLQRPGRLPFPGDPQHCPGKDAVADYLENCARTHQLPVRHNSRVTSLEPRDGGYRAVTGSGEYQAARVIISAGAYQQPRVPPVSAKLGSEVTQLHSPGYRNPGQLPAREVLVVGAANSGAQIAEDLAATHRVQLSRGARIPRMPRRVLGHSVHFYGDHLGLIAAPLDSWRGRTQRGDLLIGTSLRQLQLRHRVDLRGRTTDARKRTVSFEDGTELDVETVIWATGFRSDYPGSTSRPGRPRHAGPPPRHHQLPRACTASV